MPEGVYSGAMLECSFAAIVMDWDGTAVPDRRSGATQLCRLIHALSALGTHVGIVSGTSLRNVDGQLAARPSGPGRLFLALNRGSELFAVMPDGPQLLRRRAPDAASDQLLDLAAKHLQGRLGEGGLRTSVVSGRLNRRKVDLLPEPAWRRPRKAQLEELVTTVATRLRRCGMGSLGEVVDLARSIATEAGLPDARVTTDGKYVEIGLTDKSDAMSDLVAEFTRLGVGHGLVLALGDELGRLDGAGGSDARMLLPELSRLTAVDVGPGRGLPPQVLRLGGGPRTTRAILREQITRARHLRVPAIDLDPRWVLAADGPDPVRQRGEESVFTLVGGGIGTRGAVEEPYRFGAPLVVAAGIYTGDTSDDGLVAGPNWQETSLDRPPAHHRRYLDLRTGTLLRVASPGQGEGVPVRSLRFASAEDPGVVGLRIEGDDPALGRSRWRQRWEVVRGANGGGLGAAVAQRQSCDGAVRTVQRLAELVDTPDHAPDRDTARCLLSPVTARGFDATLALHRAAWAGRWERGGIELPCDPARELSLRFALFQLWGLAGGGRELAVGARGLSGPGYRGHVFWDADVFVLPALMTLDPDAARRMVGYRLARVPAARMRAAREGRAGARFPWESARTGMDVTPRTGWLGSEQVPILTGDLEEHITADVAWAIVRRASWQGEELSSRERELVVESARYWVSRIRIDPRGRGHIDHVIGPDEYHEDVDDNAFTNVMARWNLRTAAACAQQDVESPRWRALADALADGYRPESGIYEQFRGYLDLEPLMVAQLGHAPLAADVLAGRGRIATSQVIKQPDALMLHALVPDEVAHGSLPTNLDFYGPRTAHGSSLSPAFSALLLARARRPREALDLLSLALDVDLDDRSGMSAGGLHVGAAGGTWQAIVFGFLGLDVRADVMAVDPCLPPEWSDLTVRVQCLGTTVEVAVREGRGALRVADRISVQPPGARAGRPLESGTTMDLGKVVMDA